MTCETTDGLKKKIPPRPGLSEDKAMVQEALRIDHAGELGAIHIYRAQAAVFKAMGNFSLASRFEQKQAEEQGHYDRFCTLLTEKKVRPTLMIPLWRVAAVGLGAATALMGEAYAHACTEAVETVIADHYQEQIEAIEPIDASLAAELKVFRDDEIGHHDEAVDRLKELKPEQKLGLEALKSVIGIGCKAAIGISRHI